MKKNAYTQEEFNRLVSEVNPDIIITGKYQGVANKIEIHCTHAGNNEVYAYTLLKKRTCCKKGYHEQRVPTMKIDLIDRIAKYKVIFNESLDFTSAVLGKPQQLDNIHCNIHNIKFNQWYNSLKQGIGCPQCGKEHKSAAGHRMAPIARAVALVNNKAMYVSKSETKWLDSLEIPIRQYWLPDVKYRVDGFDPDTNTVYLFHGRFWHGCPDTYDPEYVHPIVKLKMKQLYEQTVEWEQKITAAGYNLVIEWG